MIEYTDNLDGIVPEKLIGFFVGWVIPLDPETHLKILKGSSSVVLAIDSDTGKVVGFITAISDGVFSAYIPLMEVIPAYKGQDIGTKLMNFMLQKLGKLEMIDLSCDDDLIPFYERFGMMKGNAMMLRRHDE